MKENLIKIMGHHLTFFNKALKISESILIAAIENNINEVNDQSDNRDKVIAIVSNFQATIENLIKGFKRPLEKELEEIIRKWSCDYQAIINRINEIDQKLILQMEKQKEQITQEIASVFRIKEKFKGYNLTNLKK